MSNKLQELTDKIYQEGVTKGNQEADRIIIQAKEEAEKVLQQAQRDAERIKEEAHTYASDLKKNTASELQLSARQAVEALKQDVTNLINGSITEASIKPAVADVVFIQKTIQDAVVNWAKNEELTVFVSPEAEKVVADYFATNAKELLDKGLKIETVNGIKAGFQIGPVDGSYKVSFTDTDFVNFFKEFLRPKVVELLFQGE